MIDSITNYIINKDKKENSSTSKPKSRKKFLKKKIINIFIVDKKSKSSQNIRLKDAIINLFIKDDSDTNIKEKQSNNSSKDEKEEKKKNEILQTDDSDSESYVPDNYDKLSDREKHILKLDKLNKDVGSGECPTCKEQKISITSIEIKDKNKTIKVHSCENASCHRYIYPGDRDTVGILRDKLKEKNILKKTLK